jgi:hypothetical protein
MVFLTPLDDLMMHTSALMIPSAMFAWKVEFMLEPADQISEFSSWQLSNKNVMSSHHSCSIIYSKYFCIGILT